MNATDKIDVPQVAEVILTVAEFCKKYRFGRTKYQEMKLRRETPEEVQIGNRLLITPQAEAEWLARMVERSRRMKADRFDALPAAAPMAPARALPPQPTFPSGKKIGRPRKQEAAGH